MSIREITCYSRPSACGYYSRGNCALFCYRQCADMHPEGVDTGLEIKCYIDPGECRDLDRGFCNRFCTSCAAVHLPGVWEDGEEEGEGT